MIDLKTANRDVFNVNGHGIVVYWKSEKPLVYFAERYDDLGEPEGKQNEILHELSNAGFKAEDYV